MELREFFPKFRKESFPFPPDLPLDMREGLVKTHKQYLDSIKTGGPEADCVSFTDALMQYGFNRGVGTVRLDREPTAKEAVAYTHQWAIYSGVYYDITAGQFNPWLNLDSPLPKGLVIVKPDDPLYKRYQIKKIFNSQGELLYTKESA